MSAKCGSTCKQKKGRFRVPFDHLLHIFLLIDVEHAARGHAQRRDDGQCHERERHKRVDATGNAERKRLRLGIFQVAVDVDERRFAHNARDLELHLAEDLAAVHPHDTAAELDHAVGCCRHILLIRADDDDVVAVVGDGGRHRAGLEPIALDIADADVVGVLMPLDDRDLEDVVLHADLACVARVGGDDLAGDHAQHAARTALGKALRGERRDVERLVCALCKMRFDLRRVERRDGLAVEHELALLVDLEYVEILKIVDDDEVREEAGRDGAAVIEQEVARGVMRGALDGDDGVDARLDGAADDIVDVSLFQKVVGVLVVRAEHTVGVILRREQRQQRVEVAGSGALADHDILTALDLGKRILHGGALMVGVDAGGNIGIELVAGKPGRVTVDLLVVRLRGDDFFEHLLIARVNTVGVHHLGKSLNAVVLIERVDGAVIEHRAGFIQRRGRYAGRQHKAHVNGKTLSRLKHIFDAVRAHDVCDLMRIGHDSGGAVRKHCFGKFLWGDQRAFQMDMRVQKTGQHELAAHVDLNLAAVALAHAGDQSARNGDIPMAELAAEDVDIGGVFQHQIRLLSAGSHLDHVHFLGELAIYPARVAFTVCHASSLLYDNKNLFGTKNIFYRVLRFSSFVEPKIQRFFCAN